MSHDALLTYLRDHLAGARVTLAMLHHLQVHTADPRLRTAAASFYAEVEADRDVVDQLVRRLGTDPSVMREASAWLLEKLSRLKLAAGGRSSSLAELEAVETLALCFVGKMAMWDALMAIAGEDRDFPQINYDGLRNRAQDQYRRMESQRIRLVRSLLVPSPMETELRRIRSSGPTRLTPTTRLAVA